MAVVGVLLLFSAAGAWMCVKARAAGPAAVFAAFAVLFFVATPVGSGLPHAVGVLFSVVNESTTPALNSVDTSPDKPIKAEPTSKAKG
jgi:hypothetical protein